MLDFRKVRVYNSRNFNLDNFADHMEYEWILHTLRSFDFALKKIVTVTTEDNSKGNIHVELKSNMTLETWLVKHGFEEA